MREFQRLLAEGDKEGAMAWVDDAYNADPRSEAASFAFANLMVEGGHPGPALFILRTLAERKPKSAPAWQNLARAYEEFDMPRESLMAIQRAYRLKPESPEIVAGVANAYTKAHQWDEGIEWSHKRLAMGADVQSEVNLGYAHLCMGNYAEGWDRFNEGIGYMKWRALHDYGLPQWRGEKDARVLFHREQGIGDHIAFMSCAPDAGDLIAGVVSHDKLFSLFSDSLDCPVYTEATVDTSNATHQATMSQLPQHFRRESFPGIPYLKTNPNKVIQWQALLDTLPGRMKIGIAWNGGHRNSAGGRYRSVALQDFSPLFSLDASIISLEYKPEDVTGTPVHVFPWGTQTDDYSDTAALVSCLDMVVCVPTTAYHLAGALGVPAHVWTPDRPHFHEHLPWWASVQFHPRKGTKMDYIAGLVNEQRAAA
jgi:tetratricopeptide (TPR) repeat protein